jgi:hypothetical protein
LHGALHIVRRAAALGCGRQLPLRRGFELGRLLAPLAHGSVAACSAFLAAAQQGDAAWPVYTIHETSVRQAVTPDRLLGRVNSAMHLLFWGVLPL